VGNTTTSNRSVINVAFVTQGTSNVSAHAQHKAFLLTQVTKCDAAENKFQVSAN